MDERTNELIEVTHNYRRLLAMVEAAQDAFVEVDLNGAVLNWSRGAVRLFEYSVDEITGDSITRILPTSDSQRWLALVDKLWRGEKLGDIELVCKSRSGRMIDVSASISPITDLDPESAIVGIALVMRDISERKRNEERFRMTVDAAPNAMLVVDTSGRIVLANRLARVLFKYSHKEFIGMPVENLVPERFREGHQQYRSEFMPAAIARPMGQGRELYAVTKDGQEVPVEIGLTPIESSEGLLVIAAVVDITERKRNRESILQSLREKEVLLREVHHRVKNNLQIISSLLKLQASYVPDPQLRQIVQESEERVRSMALVHEKLYRSQSLSEVNFAAYVQELTTSLFRSYVVEPQQITLDLDLEEVQLNVEKAIPSGLIINELVSNALKHAFSEARTGTVRVGLRHHNQEIELEVSDNGVGLPSHAMVHNPTTLGLRLITVLCSQLDAHLDISRKNGTQFLVRFRPKNDSENEQEQGASHNTATADAYTSTNAD